MVAALIAKENANVWFHLYYFVNQQNALQSQPGNSFYKLPFGSHGSSSTLPKFNIEPKNDGFQKESPIPGYHFHVACWTLEGYHPDLFDIHKVKSTVVHGGSNGNEVTKVIFEADNWVLCQ